MSSFLPDIIVAQAMQQLHVPSHTPASKLNAEIDAGITRLQDYRHEDGGWGWWKEDQSQVFMTAYVVSGLAQAVKAGLYQGERRQRSRRRLPEEGTRRASTHEARAPSLCCLRACRSWQ